MQQEETSTSTRAKNGKWKAESAMAESKEQLVDRAQKAYDTVVDKASEFFSGVNTNPLSFIRQYPVQAAIGGVVIGFLLGAAISRRAVSE
jgi:ElaB/YqjD/DUF883 family membrane-anchored ribosome-binding protein